MFEKTNKSVRRIRETGLALLALLALPDPAAAGDAALGEYLAAECVTCHQRSGAATGAIPPIVGLEESRFVEALMAYKAGTRANDVMRSIASRLTTEEMEALAAYFAAQKP